MKSILTTSLCLLVMTGTLLWAETLQAEDYEIQKTRQKIWNLLKEDRPAYYGERESRRDKLAKSTANYRNVEQSQSALVEEQNEFIANSLKRENINVGMSWPLTSGENQVSDVEAIQPEIAAAAEAQIEAALNGGSKLAKVMPALITDQAMPEKPSPKAVQKDSQPVAATPETNKPQADVAEAPSVVPVESDAEEKQDVSDSVEQKLPDVESVPAEEKVTKVEPAVVQADNDLPEVGKKAEERVAEDAILKEILADMQREVELKKQGKTPDVIEEQPEAVSEKKGFISGLGSLFKRKRTTSSNDVNEVAEQISHKDTSAETVKEEFAKYKEMREIVEDSELDEVLSKARVQAGIEPEIVQIAETKNSQQPQVVDLPKEVSLAKISADPLKELPNPVVISETPDVEEAVEQGEENKGVIFREEGQEKSVETEDQLVKSTTESAQEATESVVVQNAASVEDVDLAMNKGVVFQKDIPESAPEASKVDKNMKPTAQTTAVKTKKAVKRQTIKTTSKGTETVGDSIEKEFMALRASMQEDLDSTVEVSTAVVEEEAGEEEEDLMTKFKRKISPSGMLDEEIAELDYWDVPVEAQTIEDIGRNLKIEEALKEAANITLDEDPVPGGQDRKQQQKTTVVTAEEIVRQAIPAKNRDKRIDLDFDNTNLSDILLIMGEAGDMNILLDPALKSNTLDLHLKQISLEDALLLIANSYDLGFKLVGQALFITENDKLKFENKVSRIIKVRNVNVQEAKQLVEDLADQVNISEELNSLIVIGDPKDVSRVEALVEMIDNPQPQVILEAKIIEVDKNALKDLGVDWSDQINLLYQESGRPQEFDDIENSDSGFYRIGQIQRNPLQFETTIRMLEQQNKAKVLSAPRVSTLNGKQAEIFVGDEVPYTITNITGGVVTNDVRFVEPGIRLTITPSIIEDDFVVMKVEPEVSFIVAFRGPNDEFPQVRTREATAHVRVVNKQPFVLGGILNQEDKQSLFKVPFFGDLPLFGNLFSYERNTAVDTELIITVIPTIVTGR